MRKIAISVGVLIIVWLLAGQAVFGCTIVMAAKNGIVLVGNNEDWKNPKTKISFIPTFDKNYGRIFFGFNDGICQGGMNDQGLFIDANALSPTGWKPEQGKPNYVGNLMLTILAKCATIEDVQTFFETYNVEYLDQARFPVADRTGASMVVEYGQGKVQFVKKTGTYQVATNFVISNYKEGNYPCNRYRIADKILGEANEVTLPLVRAVLSATHQEGQYPTVYSNIYDLKNRLIYVYNFHNFEEVVELNFEEELKKGQHFLDLPSLFKVKPHAAKVFEEQLPIPSSDILLEIVETKGLDTALERYNQMKNDYRKIFRYDISEGQILRLGNRLLASGKLTEALAFFQANAEDHPDSWKAYDGLGRAYMKQGAREQAISCIKKSLELNPGNKNVEKMLKTLEEKK